MTSSTEYQRAAWEEPGTFEVTEGVYRIPLPLPGDALRAVNVYLIEDGDGLVLIDSGQALVVAREWLETALKSLGQNMRDIREFLVTHIHHDHYTQAIALRREYGMSVRLGIKEQRSMSLVQKSSPELFPNRNTLLARCGAEVVMKTLQGRVGLQRTTAELYEDPDLWLSDGEKLVLKTRELGVIETPGHTRGHVVFYDEKASLLFAGDHVLPHITPSIGFEPAVSEHALSDYLASLVKVGSLRDAQLLPAHGPVAPSVHERVKELISHHDVRLEATLKGVTEGRSTPYEVAGSLRWTRRGRDFQELDPFNQMLAVFETKVHLDLLAFRNQVVRTEKDGVLVFRPIPQHVIVEDLDT